MRPPVLRTLVVLGSVPALLLALWMIGRMSGVLQFYRVPTNGNAPSVPAGSLVLVHGLGDPVRGDLVSFMHAAPGERTEIWMQRLMAMAGDTVEFRHGVLLVNGREADGGLELQHTRSVSKAVFHRLVRDRVIRYEDGAETNNPDSMLVMLPDHLPAMDTFSRRALLEEEHPAIAAIYGQPWSFDRFGPYVVPPGHCFLIGDNRHASRDSRFIGPVPSTAITGVMFAHW